MLRRYRNIAKVIDKTLRSYRDSNSGPRNILLARAFRIRCDNQLHYTTVCGGARLAPFSILNLTTLAKSIRKWFGAGFGVGAGAVLGQDGGKKEVV